MVFWHLMPKYLKCAILGDGVLMWWKDETVVWYFDIECQNTKGSIIQTIKGRLLCGGKGSRPLGRQQMPRAGRRTEPRAAKLGVEVPKRGAANEGSVLVLVLLSEQAGNALPPC